MKPNTDGLYESFRARWQHRRDEARDLYQDAELTHLIGMLLDEVDAMRIDELTEEVNLSRASQLSGYHEDTLSRMVEREKLNNVGTSGRPRFKVVDLPYKPGQAHVAALRARVLGERAPAAVPPPPRLGDSRLSLVKD